MNLQRLRILKAIQALAPTFSEGEIDELAYRALFVQMTYTRPSGTSPVFSAKEIKNEEWRPISDYPGCEISSLGRVRTRAKIHKQTPQTTGYPIVKLTSVQKKGNILVSREVAKAFIDRVQPATNPRGQAE